MKSYLFITILMLSNLLLADSVPHEVREYCINGEFIGNVREFDGPLLRDLENLALDAAWNCENNYARFESLLNTINAVINSMTPFNEKRTNLDGYVNMVMQQAAHYRKQRTRRF
jgi:hypothetical protein